jgi:hypothetical protein
MKIRTLSLACATSAAMLSAGCTAVYKNSDACEQMTRDKFAEKYPQKLTISHTGAGIRGERVVVEGQFEAPPKVATDTAGASGVVVGHAGAGTAARVGVGSQAGPAPGGAGSASASGAVPSAGVPGASAASVASAPAAGASGAVVAGAPATPVTGKKKKVYTAAAAECTFSGLDLTAFHWLAPSDLASPAGEASE